MPKKQDQKTIKITYPAQLGDRIYQPGEIVTIAADYADKWIANEWAFEFQEVGE